LVTRLGTGRFEAFSDGVFAIAITLLVLELSVPDDAGDDLLGAFLDQWPSYLAYVVSFATVGAAWLAHTAMTHHLGRVDAVLVRLNLLLLLLVSFVPFPTRLVAAHIRDPGAERVATTILGLNLLLVASVTSAMWGYAVRRALVHPDTVDEDKRMLTQRLTPGLAGYVALILLGLVLPRAAVFGYLLIALVLVVPVGWRRNA
jgi:uncharacterized membrane protein